MEGQRTAVACMGLLALSEETETEKLTLDVYEGKNAAGARGKAPCTGLCGRNGTVSGPSFGGD